MLKEISYSDFKKLVVSKKLKKIVSDLYHQNEFIFIRYERYGYIS